jgi:hypothetical protein
MTQVKKSETANILKKSKPFYKIFGFNSYKSKGALANGSRKE